MKRIETYIEGLFEELPNTQQAREMKQELLMNSKEKYEDLLNNGMSSEEAEQIVIEGIGSPNEWKQAFPGSDFTKPHKKSNTAAIVFSVIMCIVVIVAIIGVGFMRTMIFKPNGPQSETGQSNVVDTSDSIKDKDDNKKQEEITDGTITTPEYFYKLKVDSVQYNVNIIIDDSVSEVELVLETNIEDKLVSEFKTVQNKEVLVIRSEIESKKNSILHSSHKGTITVKVPMSKTSNIQVDNVSGSTSIKNINSTNVYDEISIDNVSGAIELENIITKELEVNTVSGSIHMINPTITEEISIDTVSGNIQMFVSKEHPKFKVNIDGITGKYKDLRSATGEGSVEFDIDTISGSLTIEDL